jgi:hypothetical protein
VVIEKCVKYPGGPPWILDGGVYCIGISNGTVTYHTLGYVFVAHQYFTVRISVKPLLYGYWRSLGPILLVIICE